MTAVRSTTLVVLITVCGACGGASPAVPAPTPVPTASSAPPSIPTPKPVANWTGDATVTAVRRGSGGPCGWGTSPGETRNGVEWNVEITGSSITLDQDLPNWPTDDLPYSGNVRGTHFEATYYQGDDYLRWVCQFRGATITGDFDRDFSTFQAIETLGWGPPETGTSVERHWVGRRAMPRSQPSERALRSP